MDTRGYNYLNLKKRYLKFLKKDELKSKPIVDKIGKLNKFYLPLSTWIYNIYAKDNKIKIIGNFYGKINLKTRDKIINKFGKSFRLISLDALNYCLVAEGKLDAVIETNLKPYDIIPLIPILKNSGACISTWSGGNAEKGGNILATSNVKLQNKMTKILKPFINKIK